MDGIIPRLRFAQKSKNCLTHCAVPEPRLEASLPDRGESGSGRFRPPKRRTCWWWVSARSIGWPTGSGGR
jgi:hypothetical protein